MRTITSKESTVLSCVRIAAVIMIVLCHYFQAYDIKWAYVLNVGVQLFIILSGFLYGHKVICSWKEWWTKRLIKLYPPVFVFLTLVTPLYLTLKPDSFNVWGMICNYTNIQGIPFAVGGKFLVGGTRHLWFLTAIAMAYCITPILQKLKSYACIVFCLLWVTQVFAYFFLPKSFAFILSWLSLYGIGYMFANMNRKSQDFMLIFLLAIMAIILCYIHWSQITVYFNPLNRLMHDVLGSLLLFGGYKLLCWLPSIRLTTIAKLIDNYSYHIYIIHYFLLIGPFSLLHITDSVYSNILISFVSIIIITSIFAVICQSINNVLIRK